VIIETDLAAPPDWIFIDGFDCGESRGANAPAICP